MAEAMLNFLSQIIGKGEKTFEEVLAAQEGMLASIKGRILIFDALALERPFSTEECRQTLFAIDLEKSLGWNRLTIKFFKEIWLELSEPVTTIANKALMGGGMEEVVTRNLIKPIP